MPAYIIEHLEKKLWEWCLIEYKHISRIVKSVWFTNVESKELEKYGKIIGKSVVELKLQNACVLDPEANKTLTPKEAKTFNYFVFGGILGDDPPKKRTEPELTSKLNCEVRNIGKKQMSTDTAVYVVKQIVNGKKLSELKFQDEIEIKLGKNESTVLPYRYVVVNGKPLVSKELVDYLKNREGF